MSVYEQRPYCCNPYRALEGVAFPSSQVRSIIQVLCGEMGCLQEVQFWEARMEAQKALSRNDSERVAALQKYAILDTEPEQAFDDLTLLAFPWSMKTGSGSNPKLE
jgi:hypothetical protein